jgi:hypothetical protein
MGFSQLNDLLLGERGMEEGCRHRREFEYSMCGDGAGGGHRLSLVSISVLDYRMREGERWSKICSISNYNGSFSRRYSEDFVEDFGRFHQISVLMDGLGYNLFLVRIQRVRRDEEHF